jgi:hypothetical protein
MVSTVIVSKNEAAKQEDQTSDMADFTRTVDNESLVEEQNKHQAQERQQERVKTGEREERAPESTGENQAPIAVSPDTQQVNVNIAQEQTPAPAVPAPAQNNTQTNQPMNEGSNGQ